MEYQPGWLLSFAIKQLSILEDLRPEESPEVPAGHGHHPNRRLPQRSRLAGRRSGKIKLPEDPKYFQFEKICDTQVF